ncbi:MAG TPA: phosphate ABC transporter substrate-binding protein PstS [Blastocatellia bacterium]|nr:phosphate ABC transporter substrate-binding protein PstS [Blastocatellia bacterium]
MYRSLALAIVLAFLLGTTLGRPALGQVYSPRTGYVSSVFGAQVEGRPFQARYAITRSWILPGVDQYSESETGWLSRDSKGRLSKKADAPCVSDCHWVEDPVTNRYFLGLLDGGRPWIRPLFGTDHTDFGYGRHFTSDGAPIPYASEEIISFYLPEPEQLQDNDAKSIGRKTIDGLDCEGFVIAYPDRIPGGYKIEYWVSSDIKRIVYEKIAAKNTEQTYVLSNIAQVEPPASEFTIPEGEAGLPIRLKTQPAPASKRDVRLKGAGAFFPNPLYQKWISVYIQKHPNVELDYQSIGSDEGFRQICSQTVDFAGSDFVLTDEQLSAAPAGLLHIPSTVGAVVVTYNLPSLGKAPLKLSGETLAAIYLGHIKKWNDPEIAQQNPGVSLPDADILVVHRSDSNPISFLFADFLSKSSPEWNQKVGAVPAPDWPIGVEARGSTGIEAQVNKSENSIGYVEFNYAQMENLKTAAIRGIEGDYVRPTLESITAAAAGAAPGIPSDLRASITAGSGEGAYPISYLSYILIYEEQRDPAKGKALADFLLWAIHDGQTLGPKLNYAPLPPEIVQTAERQIHGFPRCSPFQGRVVRLVCRPWFHPLLSDWTPSGSELLVAGRGTFSVLSGRPINGFVICDRVDCGTLTANSRASFLPRTAWMHLLLPD